MGIEIERKYLVNGAPFETWGAGGQDEARVPRPWKVSDNENSSRRRDRILDDQGGKLKEFPV